MIDVRWMFHATAMVRDYDAAIEPLVRLFGARILHDNVVVDPGIGRRGGMTWIGDGSLEVGEPAGPDSPVDAFLERFGGGMHSVGLQVADAAAAKEHLASVGVRIVGEPAPGLFFTHPADTAGLLLEWNANPQSDDPRWGGEVPDGPDPVVGVERLAFVGAVVRDPHGDARRLAEVIGLPVTFEASDEPPPARPHPGAIVTAVSVGDCSLALSPVEGSGQTRPRVLTLGLLVHDLPAAEAALAGEDAASLPFPIVLTDGLLPGDPRDG
jgi:catechol 2,3-dioxygenase-like lactoylglutathione lyase family enzyme